MTQSTTCPHCGATMWRGSLHCCPRRNEPAPPPPGSSLAHIALWAVVGAIVKLAIALGVGLALGWALGWL